MIIHTPDDSYPLIGWREYVSLPGLGIKKIKAKIDTGAKTSALHAFSLEHFTIGNKNKIKFKIHPLQHNAVKTLECEADVVDLRYITDSGGHKEQRYVISTPISIYGITWPIEITLTERDTMLFRMLLGRSALNKFIINPSKSFIAKNKQVGL